MFFQKLLGFAYIIFGSFLLIVIGGKLLLQLLAILFGFIFIVRGCYKLGMCKIKASMNNFCDF
ncbi:hypothetical protein KBB68_00755 [Candidatus Babeliales bacterium]|nr:hypothetical protein [Candidatus Babeliales bacterium]